MDPRSHHFIDPETFIANGLYKGGAIWSDIARYLNISTSYKVGTKTS